MKILLVGNKAGEIHTGADNTFIGSEAGDGTDDGTRNVAVGKHVALSANLVRRSENAAVGKQCWLLVTGANNTLLVSVWCA